MPLGVAGVLLAATLAFAWVLWSAREPARDQLALASPAIGTLAAPKPLGDFTLKDDADRVFDLASLRGKWTFLFFGFISCPDICPTTMVSLARVRERLVEMGVPPAELQFVFVSVDPQRDTAAIIERYVEHFDARFLGTTGSVAQLTNLARQLGAAFRVDYAEGENYPVQHTSAVFLIDPLARLAGIVPSPLDPPAVARGFGELRGGFSADRPS